MSGGVDLKSDSMAKDVVEGEWVVKGWHPAPSCLKLNDTETMEGVRRCQDWRRAKKQLTSGTPIA